MRLTGDFGPDPATPRRSFPALHLEKACIYFVGCGRRTLGLGSALITGFIKTRTAAGGATETSAAAGAFYPHPSLPSPLGSLCSSARSRFPASLRAAIPPGPAADATRTRRCRVSAVRDCVSRAVRIASCLEGSFEQVHSGLASGPREGTPSLASHIAQSTPLGTAYSRLTLIRRPVRSRQDGEEEYVQGQRRVPTTLSAAERQHFDRLESRLLTPVADLSPQLSTASARRSATRPRCALTASRFSNAGYITAEEWKTEWCLACPSHGPPPKMSNVGPYT